MIVEPNLLKKKTCDNFKDLPTAGEVDGNNWLVTLLIPVSKNIAQDWNKKKVNKENKHEIIMKKISEKIGEIKDDSKFLTFNEYSKLGGNDILYYYELTRNYYAVLNYYSNNSLFTSEHFEYRKIVLFNHHVIYHSEKDKKLLPLPNAYGFNLWGMNKPDKNAIKALDKVLFIDNSIIFYPFKISRINKLMFFPKVYNDKPVNENIKTIIYSLKVERGIKEKLKEEEENSETAKLPKSSNSNLYYAPISNYYYVEIRSGNDPEKKSTSMKTAEIEGFLDKCFIPYWPETSKDQNSKEDIEEAATPIDYFMKFHIYEGKILYFRLWIKFDFSLKGKLKDLECTDAESKIRNKTRKTRMIKSRK